MTYEAMTIGELINELSKIDPLLPVVVNDFENGFRGIASIQIGYWTNQKIYPDFLDEPSKDIPSVKAVLLAW